MLEHTHTHPGHTGQPLARTGVPLSSFRCAANTALTWAHLWTATPSDGPPHAHPPERISPHHGRVPQWAHRSRCVPRHADLMLFLSGRLGGELLGASVQVGHPSQSPNALSFWWAQHRVWGHGWGGSWGRRGAGSLLPLPVRGGGESAPSPGRTGHFWLLSCPTCAPLSPED